MNECEFFDRVKNLVDSLTNKGLVRMLNKSNQAIKLMEETNYYKGIENDLRSGKMKFGILGNITNTLDPNDASIIIWLTGFRVAAESADAERMMYQTAVYIASQKLSIHRIKDDKVRLVMTYIHFSAIETLLPED